MSSRIGYAMPSAMSAAKLVATTPAGHYDRELQTKTAKFG
jgi:hypothetical protein